jgi:glycosyltransferase involved in cell wall biosynthesis
LSHILIIPSWYRGTYDANNGSYVREQALALKERGHKVGVVYNNIVYWYYIKDQRKLHCLGFKDYDDSGLPTYYTDTLQVPSSMFRTWNRFAHFFNRIRNILVLKWMVRKYIAAHGKPDIIHAHSFYPGPALPAVSKAFRIPYVITEHWSGFNDRFRRASRLGSILGAYSDANRVIAVSESLATQVQAVVGKECVEVPNCIDFRNFKIADARYEQFTFSAVGYFRAIKRYDLLIHAFARAFRHVDGVRLLMVGSGELQAELEDLVSQLGMEHKIEFAGRRSRDEVAEILAKSHVVVSSSAYETFGMTLIESLACGTPVVAMNIGGPVGIVNRPEFGILADDTEDSLSEALFRIHGQYNKYDPTLIRSLAYDRYSEDIVIQRIGNIYEDVITRYREKSFG